MRAHGRTTSVQLKQKAYHFHNTRDGADKKTNSEKEDVKRKRASRNPRRSFWVRRIYKVRKKKEEFHIFAVVFAFHRHHQTHKVKDVEV